MGQGLNELDLAKSSTKNPTANLRTPTCTSRDGRLFFQFEYGLRPTLAFYSLRGLCREGENRLELSFGETVNQRALAISPPLHSQLLTDAPDLLAYLLTRQHESSKPSGPIASPDRISFCNAKKASSIIGGWRWYRASQKITEAFLSPFQICLRTRFPAWD
ncbi:Oxidored_FMN domain-containing protein [Psidium guajava]|nr:Oxidored_FMN domain-containing protein [Psidium guajava]